MPLSKKKNSKQSCKCSQKKPWEIATLQLMYPSSKPWKSHNFENLVGFLNNRKRSDFQPQHISGPLLRGQPGMKSATLCVNESLSAGAGQAGTGRLCGTGPRVIPSTPPDIFIELCLIPAALSWAISQEILANSDMRWDTCFTACLTVYWMLGDTAEGGSVSVSLKDRGVRQRSLSKLHYRNYRNG